MASDSAPAPEPIPRAVARPIVVDGALSRLMDVLTGGAFLAGLGILVGANTFQLGVLASLPFLAQVAQLPTLSLLLRVTDRRRVVVVAAGLARLLLAAVAAILWLKPEALVPGVLMSILAAGALLAVTATAAWNWWMRDLLPPNRLGGFFSSRMRTTTLVALAALLAAGWGLDVMTRRGLETQGYAVLFSLGALCGFGGLAFLRATPHAPPPPSPPAAHSFRLLGDALRRQETRAALAALSAVSVAITFALPFAAVFLLRTLGYSYLVVTALAITSQAGYLAGLRGWGHLSDRHGDRGVLFVSMGLLSSSLAGLALTGWSAGGAWLVAWFALLHFASGFALGGADLGATNLMLKTAPAPHAQAHLAAVSLGKALCAGAGTLLAGALWQGLGRGPLWTVDLPLTGAWSLRGFQVLCLVSLVLTWISWGALARVREPEHRAFVDVTRAMRREVQQMSSVAGIRGFIHAVSYSVEFAAAPFAARLEAGHHRRRRPRGPEDAAPPGP